jgi:hypothetical protein
VLRSNRLGSLVLIGPRTPFVSFGVCRYPAREARLRHELRHEAL